jgi:hypothetical protein
MASFTCMELAPPQLFETLLQRSGFDIGIGSAEARSECTSSSPEHVDIIADCSTVGGRAYFVRHQLPPGVTVCDLLALWVWQGGAFPSSITVRSTSRSHTSLCGRAISWTERRLKDDDIRIISGLRITSPIKTICDVLCGPYSSTITANRLLFFLAIYGLTAEECQLFITQRRYPRAQTVLSRLAHLTSEGKEK